MRYDDQVLLDRKDKLVGPPEALTMLTLKVLLLYF